MLKNAEIEAIRERVEKATEGEWRIADTTEGAWLLDGNDLIIAGTFERIEDAVFSKHARQDIPKLLAEIERLREEIEGMKLQQRADAEYHDYYGGDIE